MTNLELADKLQAAASNHYGDLCGMLWDGGAALRKLHTENMALRCTEMALRDTNAELVGALKASKTPLDLYNAYGWPDLDGVREMVKNALAKAEGGEL